MLTIFFQSIAISTVLYYYLHKKTKISLKYLFIDNVLVSLSAAALLYLLSLSIPEKLFWICYILNIGFVVILAFALTMIRFWRTPNRKITARDNEIVSPADGNIIYIKSIGEGQVPISIKNNRSSKLVELTKTDILDGPCWLVGINMTPFDVHKNCAPIDGKIIVNSHHRGKFLSLKAPEAVIENERNTYIIENDRIKVGVVQIASRLVRRIDSYVKVEQNVRKGDWLGMIRFGSQVDVIIPINYEVQVKLKDQIYAGETVIASERENQGS